MVALSPGERALRDALIDVIEVLINVSNDLDIVTDELRASDVDGLSVPLLTNWSPTLRVIRRHLAGLTDPTRTTSE